ncbi:MAG: hypothetical protein ATN35_09470 [Epulopiscium sp. Nele67-Bin004]|nr:MAG: hypothetical protein ATN35_09470 [Epulopiscium sp. Nele67-Bin004]
MKISKKIKVSNRVKVYSLKRIKKGKYPKNLYFLCTSPYNSLGFEIIKGKYLTTNYKNSYLLGVTKDKDTVIEYLRLLIDEMYNKQTFTYDTLLREVKE